MDNKINKITFIRFKKKSIYLIYYLLQENILNIIKIKNKKLFNSLTRARISNTIDERIIKLDDLEEFNVKKKGKKTNLALNYINTVTKLNDYEILLGYKEYILIWNLVTGLSSHSISAHKSEVYCITKLNYNQILSGGSDKLVKLWTKNLRENAFFRQRTFSGHTSAVISIIKLNKYQIASGCDDSLRVWDLEDGECLKMINTDINNSVYLETLNKYYFAFTGGFIEQSGDFYIKIMDINTKDCKNTLLGHTNYIYNLNKFNDNMFISGSEDTTIKIWCTNTWTCLKTLNESNRISYMITIDNNYFAYCILNETNIKVRKLKSDYSITKDCELDCYYIPKGDALITIARINISQIISIYSYDLKMQVININI